MVQSNVDVAVPSSVDVAEQSGRASPPPFGCESGHGPTETSLSALWS